MLWNDFTCHFCNQRYFTIWAMHSFEGGSDVVETRTTIVLNCRNFAMTKTLRRKVMRGFGNVPKKNQCRHLRALCNKWQNVQSDKRQWRCPKAKKVYGGDGGHAWGYAGLGNHGIMVMTEVLLYGAHSRALASLIFSLVGRVHCSFSKDHLNFFSIAQSKLMYLISYQITYTFTFRTQSINRSKTPISSKSLCLIR